MIHFYTHGDLDGIGCALLATLAFGDDGILPIYVDYDDVDERLEGWLTHNPPGQQLFITDICPNVNVVNLIRKQVEAGSLKALIVDHHKTTAWLAEFNLPYFIHDTSACGTKLFYRWLRKKPEQVKRRHYQWRVNCPELIRLVDTIDVYDRWLTQDPLWADAERLNRLCLTLGRDAFIECFYNDLEAHTKPRMVFLDDIMQHKEMRAVMNILAEQLKAENIFCDRNGQKFLLTVSAGNISQIANEALKAAEPEVDVQYVVILDPLYNKVHLRSRAGGVDVSAIAEKFGGGGHPPAAGFPFPFEYILRNMFSRGWF